MRIPIPERAIIRAKEYTEKSYNFTHDHPGWENKQSKEYRIFLGKVSEYTVIDYLRINGKQIQEDKTDHTQNDYYDFIFKFNRYDVKSTYTNRMPICITRTYENKPIDYFIGVRIDFELKYIELLGVIPKEDTVVPGYFKKEGDEIEGSGYTCTFTQGAYYFTGNYESIEHHFEITRTESHIAYWRDLYFEEKSKNGSSK